MRCLMALCVVFYFISASALAQAIAITARLHEASWYSLPNWEHNGVPKYSGPMGTYTAKHIPIAIQDSGVDYYVFSENSTGNLKIFVADSLGNKTLVHQTDGVIDPHDNAVINIRDGYLYIVVAARSNRREGIVYRADEKHSIASFTKVSEGWYAYPQLWPTALLYTDYTEQNIRELWVKSRYCNKKLVEGGHYSVSFDDGEYLHLAYNYHTDDNLDRRQHIFYMRSKDGCNWETSGSEPLSLPLHGYSSQTLVYDSDSTYEYMKDIAVIDGEVNILTVNSSSFYPDEGVRYAYNTDLYGNRTAITETGHNYNTGAYVDGYIVFPTFGESGYAGGDLSLFTLDGELLHRAGYGYKYNYVRKVVGGTGAYLSEAPSSISNKGAFVRKIEIIPHCNYQYCRPSW